MWQITAGSAPSAKSAPSARTTQTRTRCSSVTFATEGELCYSVIFVTEHELCFLTTLRWLSKEGLNIFCSLFEVAIFCWKRRSRIQCRLRSSAPALLKERTALSATQWAMDGTKKASFGWREKINAAGKQNLKELNLIIDLFRLVPR